MRTSSLLPKSTAALRSPEHHRGGLTTWKNFRLGYIAVKGSQAVVGVTGTYCTAGQTPGCVTNSDPAAIFSAARTFPVLFAQAEAGNNPNVTGNSYTLAPCVRIGTNWYLYQPPGSF